MDSVEIQNFLLSDNQEKYNGEFNNEETKNSILLEYKKFMSEIKGNLSKCKYRRAFEVIERKENLFIDYVDSWKIKEIKIITILRILNKKIYKSESSKQSKEKSIENWLKKIDNVFDIWITNINLKEETYEQFESLLNLFLEELLFIAKFKKQEILIADCSAILGISESIMKYFYDYSMSPHFYNICQQIYLFISSLLISDNDYLIAKTYQALAIKSAFKELFLRIDIEEGTNLNNLKKISFHKFNKTFVNIVLAFYQRGVTEENCGKYLKAIESYKQAVWFSQNFIKYQYPEISQLISDIRIRAESYHDFIENKVFEKFNKYLSKLDMNDKKSTTNIKRDIFSIYKEKLYQEKEKEINEIINSFNFREFEFPEDEKKSLNVKSILSTLTLLNNFSSDQFRDLLCDDIDVQNINNLEESTLEKIQKRLNQIKTEQLFQKREKEKNLEKFKTLMINSQLLKSTIMSCVIKNPETLSDHKNLIPEKSRNGTTNINKEESNLQSIKLINDVNKSPDYSYYNINNENCLSNDIINGAKETKINSSIHAYPKLKNSQSLIDLEFLRLGIENPSPIKPKIIKETKKSPLPFKNAKDLKSYLSSKNSNGLLNNIDKSFEKEEKFENGNQSKTTSRHIKNKSCLFSNIKTHKQTRDSVKKYNHDKFTFSKTFHNKFKKLDDLTRKETEFQKKILRLKSHEQLPDQENIKNNNAYKILSETENFFNRIISGNLTNFINTDNDPNKKKTSDNLKDFRKFHKERIKNRLEVSVLKSLEVKSLDKWDNFVKNSCKKEQKILRDEFINTNRDIITKPLDQRDRARKVNDQQIKIIEKDLEKMDKEGDIFKKMLNNKLDIEILKKKLNNYEYKSQTMSLGLNKNTKNIDSFVKIPSKAMISNILKNGNL